MQGKVHIARASHCLGVFGGTSSDYSGGSSLHAAMPHACFVACQMQPMEASQSRGITQGCITLQHYIAVQQQHWLIIDVNLKCNRLHGVWAYCCWSALYDSS